MRREYRKLVVELPALVADFGGALAPLERADARVLTTAVECVDRVLDAECDAARRAAFADAIVAALDGGGCATGCAEVDERLAELRRVIARRRIAPTFVRLARDTLATTESMRAATRARDYLDAIEREGRLLVELTLQVLGPRVPRAFVEFLRATAELGNLADKLVDARGDFRRGEIAVRPGVVLHVRLAIRLARRIPRALASHPRRLRFVVWGASWLDALT